MPATYDPIATTTLVGPNDAITFSSIPTTYTDLRIIFNGRMNTTAAIFNFRMNNDSSSIYSNTFLTGNGSTVSSNTNTNTTFLAPSSSQTMSATTPTFVTIDLLSYASSSTRKTALITGSYDQNGSGITSASIGYYRSNSAVTSVTLSNTTFNSFAVGTIATLYGILRA